VCPGWLKKTTSSVARDLAWLAEAQLRFHHERNIAMNRRLSPFTFLLVLSFSGFTLGCHDADPTGPSSELAANQSLAKDDALWDVGSGGSQRTISTEEADDLVFMREEEKLARDVYTTMHERWGHLIFLNIAQSEETHMAALLRLLERYSIPDPVGQNSVGVFTNPQLQDLYEQLITQGNTSLEEAFRVGVLIEEKDIADNRDAIARADNRDIVRVYTNLVWGSENHLRAFTKVLSSYLDRARL
jgi:hypothetical protein